jgi:hypothetical protein
MNRRFVEAVERAFELRLESRAAAAATVYVNGKQRTDEIAIELAWRWFVDVKFDASAAEVMSRCPGVAPESVRVAFKERLQHQFCFGG